MQIICPQREFVKILKHKKLVEYHDFYLDVAWWFLADVFNKIWNKCYEIYGLDPAYFPSATGLPWQATLKKIKEKLDLLIDIDMLLMVEKEIRDKICHATHEYVKDNNIFIKEYDQNK